jgi:hypothetical protein
LCTDLNNQMFDTVTLITFYISYHNTKPKNEISFSGKYSVRRSQDVQILSAPKHKHDLLVSAVPSHKSIANYNFHFIRSKNGRK